MPLYTLLAPNVDDWRTAGYPSPDYPAISEILNYAWLTPHSQPRFLRLAQICAIETYWYLRLIEETPKIIDLYKKLFPQPSDCLAAIGMGDSVFLSLALNIGFDGLLNKVRQDDAFVKQYHLEALRETLDLDYPSYILALAMGAGKTMLIGAIIATEFAMALEYPTATSPFIHNALVFAPGRTILDALRELADVSYEQILPPRLYKLFTTHYKLTFTRDGEKDLPVIRKSNFNIIVTNTEKIRIQKRSVRSRRGWTQLKLAELEKQEEEIANLRLQAIASLPNLGIFSDEAHHTYGQAMEVDLKRVRQTVNYLHTSTNLICVVNTTGTPYYQRQLLKDVVVWYSLSQGIRDNILKDLSDSIYSYSFDDSNTGAFVAEVVGDFLAEYGDVRLPNGAAAKLALYFPQEDDLVALRPVIERTLAEKGYPATVVLKNTSRSTQAEVGDFNRLNAPNSPHRVILLVNKGTEGWNCPSLFATALARRLRTSNNFVLQAATRCLRQVPGNTRKGRVYLSRDNYSTLDAQLQETYGESLGDLNRVATQSQTRRLVVRKTSIPPLVVRLEVKTVVAAQPPASPPLALTRPDVQAESLVIEHATLSAEGAHPLQFRDQTVVMVDSDLDLYTAAVRLAATYRLDSWVVYTQLKQAYAPERSLSEAHLPALAAQIEVQTRNYTVQTQIVHQALALIRLDGFDLETDPQGQAVYTTTIQVPVNHLEQLEHAPDPLPPGQADLGFHYTPYNFDSAAEQTFFQWLLGQLRLDPDDVQDIYFTGGLTAEKHSDFYVAYQGLDGRPHRYVPDFLILKKDGRCLIVEIKDARWETVVQNDLALVSQGQEALSVEGRKLIALQRWTNLDPKRLAYQVIFAASAILPNSDLDKISKFLYPQP